MSDDRLAHARAEAERRYGRIGGIPQDALFMFKTGAFVDGVEWADANPQPRTITIAQSEAILGAGRSGRYEDHEAALRAAGIEVDDAIDVAHSSRASDKFRYFCGVCWAKVRKLQDTAFDIVEADDGA